MRKYIKTKLLAACALFLALVMLFSSCSLFFESREEPEYIEGQRLEIEKSDISYTSEQSDDITKKMASVAALFMSRRDGIAVDEELIADIELNIAGEIIPSLEGSDISYERISSLIEDVTDLINSDEITMDASLYNDIYLMCMDKLGREKSGKMIYSSTVMYLERKADMLEKRYEEFGYEWYLTDAEKYRTLIRDMKDVLGEYEFTDAMSIVFFFATLMNGTPLISGNESSFYVDASEMLVLLKKQVGMIADHKMSGEQWKVVTRLAFELGLCEYEPSENLKDVQREMLTALKNCPEYADALGELMPEVSALYVSIVDKLNEGSLTLIMSGNREVATGEILRLMSLCENEFFSVVKNFEACGGFKSQYELEAIENAGSLEDFQKYSKYRKNVTSGQLFNSLKQCAQGKIEKADFMRTYENFMYTNAPYFTYAFIFLNK